MDLVFAPLIVEAWLLVALVIGAGAIGFGISKPARRRSRWKPSIETNFRRPQLVEPASSTRPLIGDTADQLRAVMSADFFQKRVLSKTEGRVLAAAEQAIAEAGLRWRVMAQVALGEVLGSESKPGFLAINAKRVDLLVMSEDCKPIAAIEYQGSGHHLGSDASARDAIKKEALRKAGVRFIEIDSNDGPADVRREIGRLAFLVAEGSQTPKPLQRRA
jgi:hypothetical protein